MKFTPPSIKLFTLLKLPSAFFTGVRLIEITANKSVVSVKHRWINQNPFRSVFWAIQGMAAELATGVLVMRAIQDSGRQISMLVVEMNANFSKKATGKIFFSCDQSGIVKAEIDKAIEINQGRTFILNAKGVNEDGKEVSNFNFKWSIKVK